MLTFYLSEIEKEEDKKKFEKIYFHYQDDMHVIANKILRNSEDAEDAVQDAFVLIIRNLDKIGDVYSKTTRNYVMIIVKNRALQIYNRLKKRESVANDYNFFEHLPDYFQNVEEQVENKEVIDIIKRMIHELPDKYKEVLYLYYYNNISYAKIAEMLDITDVNARQVARRARKILEEKIQKEKILDEEFFEGRLRHE